MSKEDFVAMVSERLAAVAKDRETMRKRAQEQARQEGGRSFEDIMVSVGGGGGRREETREDRVGKRAG